MAEEIKKAEPKKKGIGKKILRGLGIALGIGGVAMAAVAVDKKTGIITKANNGVADAYKWGKDKFTKKTVQPETPAAPVTETKPQNNNGYSQNNNWQPRENGRPYNRPQNN